MNDLSGLVERYYWKTFTFLVILILVGSGLWGLRRFAPTLFLGEPDLIAVPKNTGTETTTSRAVSTPERLNINDASAKELQTLPNIGASKAERIVQYRTEHGNFADVDGLQQVKGIGAKTVEKLRPFVTAK